MRGGDLGLEVGGNLSLEAGVGDLRLGGLVLGDLVFCVEDGRGCGTTSAAPTCIFLWKYGLGDIVRPACCRGGC